MPGNVRPLSYAVQRLDPESVVRRDAKHKVARGRTHGTIFWTEYANPRNGV